MTRRIHKRGGTEIEKGSGELKATCRGEGNFDKTKRSYKYLVGSF